MQPRADDQDDQGEICSDRSSWELVGRLLAQGPRPAVDETGMARHTTRIRSLTVAALAFVAFGIVGADPAGANQPETALVVPAPAGMMPAADAPLSDDDGIPVDAALLLVGMTMIATGAGIVITNLKPRRLTVGLVLAA